ncbi:MAG: LysR family transcriptional regulator [Pseudomonadota bacterium]
MPAQRIPSLNWLRVFEAAARSGSFARAAEILNMSPAAVSQQIKALESHLGAPLFRRSPRAVMLNEAGIAFLPVVRQALLSVETTAAALFARPKTARVSLQAPLIFATSWLAARLGDLEARHPEIELSVMGLGELQEGPLGRFDLHVVFGLPAPNWGHSDLLFGERVYPLARAEFAAKLARPEDLLQHRLLEIASHKASWLQLLEQAGLEDLSAARLSFTDSSDIALARAAEGQGIALARAPATDGREALYGLVPCCPGLEMPGIESYHLVSPPSAGLSQAAAAVRDWLLEVSAGYR